MGNIYTIVENLIVHACLNALPLIVCQPGIYVITSGTVRKAKMNEVVLRSVHIILCAPGEKGHVSILMIYVMGNKTASDQQMTKQFVSYLNVLFSVNVEGLLLCVNFKTYLS